MTDTAKGTIVAGIFALAGALGGAAVTGWSQVQLAKQKFNSDLVLKALESGDPTQRLESLRLLVETNLIQDPKVKVGVRDYAKAKESTPETIPQIVSASPTLTNFKTAREVQMMFKELGHYDGPVEDFYSPEFRKALIKFQQERGLVADGQVGAQTLSTLLDEYNSRQRSETRP